MKHLKNLSVCNNLLKELQELNKEKSEAVSRLKRAQKKLNRMKRGGVISQMEIFEAVRDVAEAVLKSFDE